MAKLSHELERQIAVTALRSIDLEVRSIDRENRYSPQTFRCNDERCIRQIHSVIRVLLHQLECA
jgi:hypothetical protein